MTYIFLNNKENKFIICCTKGEKSKRISSFFINSVILYNFTKNNKLIKLF